MKKKLKKEVMLMTKAFFVVALIALTFASCATTHNVVTFSAMGAAGTVPQDQRVPADTAISLPGGEGLSMGDAIFSGWIRFADGQATRYNPGVSFTPTENARLMAHWKVEADNLSEVRGLVNQLIWVMNNAESNSTHIIELNQDEVLPTERFDLFSYYNRENITIILRGAGENRTIRHAEQGLPTLTQLIRFDAPTDPTMFTIFSGVSLVLENITIEAHPPHSPIVSVWGNLTMNSGSVIIGNAGTGVSVLRGGTLTMNDGASITRVSGRGGTRERIEGGSRYPTRSGGIGVNLAGGTFTMNEGATISYNNEHGVSVGSAFAGSPPGTFIMHGGTIAANGGARTAAAGALPPRVSGGGVAIYDGTFTMNGGSITYNAVQGFGGGVVVGVGSTVRGRNSTVVFNMAGGEITTNHAAGDGRTGGVAGGVLVHAGATFNMSGGNIANNIATRGGNNLEVLAPHGFGETAIVNTTGGSIQR